MATFDAHATLARGTVVTAPAPALTGLSLTVGAGEGAVFPAAPFNCTVYPPDQVPTLANAEVVRVTAVVGDTLTIVRAQENTTAKAIAAGYLVSNSVSVKVFTDIENAINANIQSISAGAGVATSNQIVFSDGNGVSFGAAGNSVITASHDGLTSQSNQAFSAQGGSSAFQTLGFSNTNGISFSNSNGSVVASHDGLTSQSAQAASASNGSFAFQTLNFSNANNVTFGTSAGGIITASVATAAAGNSVNFSAGTTSNNLGSVVFSNSNGVTFGLDAGTITASHNGLTSQSAQAASASNGSFAFQTLAFSDANNVTFGTSAGGIITASVATAGGGSINFSAGTTSNNLASIIFSNSNNVTFGLNAGTITASASGAGGGGVTISQFTHPDLLNGPAAIAVGNSTSYGGGFLMPQPISFDFARFAFFMRSTQTNIATIASASATASMGISNTHFAVIYSFGTGASSLSLQSVASGSASQAYSQAISITNSSQGSYSQGITAPFRDGYTSLTTQYSISNSVYSFSTSAIGSLFGGERAMDIALNTTLSAGNYWMILGALASTASGGPVGLSRIMSGIVSASAVYFASQRDIAVLEFGSANPTPPNLGGGSFSGTFQTTASIAFSNIERNQSNNIPYFQLLRHA